MLLKACFICSLSGKDDRKSCSQKKYEKPKLTAALWTMPTEVQNTSLGQVKYFLASGIHLMYKQLFMLTFQ